MTYVPPYSFHTYTTGAQAPAAHNNGIINPLGFGGGIGIGGGIGCGLPFGGIGLGAPLLGNIAGLGGYGMPFFGGLDGNMLTPF